MTKKESPLIEAMYREDFGRVRQLLSAGENVNTTDRLGRTLLMHAAGDKRVDLVRELVRREADIDLQDKEGYSALHLAASAGDLEIVGLIVKKGATVESIGTACRP